MDNAAESCERKSGYDYIVTKFGEDKIISRYSWLYDMLNDFIDLKECKERVIVSNEILKHVIVDYFVDIDRLKEFHTDIEKVNDAKVYAYLSFWILRHKPLQLICGDNNGELAFINEDFADNFLRSLLFSEPNNVPILNNQIDKIDSFLKTMCYNFKYRDFSAKTIELMILAFLAGRGYQYSVDKQE